MDVDREGIAAAAAVIAPHIRRTPAIDLDGVTLKLELVQHAGSFKTRGAFANLLLREMSAAGVVAASGGNHGGAIAYAAQKLGRPAKIFVPSYASPAKVERIRDYGADLVLCDSIGEVFAGAEAWAASTGAVYVHPFDQIETMCGAGTVALELEQQAPGLDTVLVAVGGGGLIAGVGAWYGGATRVIGVEPETAATLYRAFEAGGPVDVPGSGYAQDSLAPPRVGARVYPIARRYVERVVLVTDDAIREAQRRLWSAARIVAEAGGSAALAALVSGRYVPAAGERVGVVVSGGNTVAVNFQ
ncbi:MAG TPA: serine/threonine dehydratase [Gemmatimonadaceae bacterium]|jgi:threonine dehydratase|nr:serine/threonine dehydratase [Gemmatimonadaceae bacterium]